MISHYIWTVCWGPKVETLPPCWNLLAWVGLGTWNPVWAGPWNTIYPWKEHFEGRSSIELSYGMFSHYDLSPGQVRQKQTSLAVNCLDMSKIKELNYQKLTRVRVRWHFFANIHQKRCSSIPREPSRNSEVPNSKSNNILISKGEWSWR
jgi:hypothetical protein